VSRQLRRHERCLNCGEPVTTDFCGRCGQENTDYRVSLLRLFGDLAEELFQLESRLWRTLWTLVRKPGLLTVEYNAGRRVRYTAPLRLYLLASVAYFAMMSLLPAKTPRIEAKLDAKDEAELSRELDAELRSPFERRLKTRVLELSKSDPQALGERVTAALESQVPKAMVVLLPAFALLSWLFFRTPRMYYVEHLVLALHVHAFAFLVMLLGWLTRNDVLALSSLPLAWLWMVLAMRRVFGRGWWATIWRAVLIGNFYSNLVVLALAAIAVLSLGWK
jgi:hypothetical protein